VIEDLAASGRNREAERSLDVLRRLARRSPTWHLTLALVLGELGRWDEAQTFLTERDESEDDDAESRRFRMQLELRLCTQDLAVRTVIGEIAGRSTPIERTEAKVMAEELVRIVMERTAGSAIAAPSEGLAMVATIVMVEADRRGFRAITEGLGALSVASLPVSSDEAEPVSPRADEPRGEDARWSPSFRS
jgi:hypothetical protein